MHRYKSYYSNITSYDLIFKDHFINVMQLPKFNNITLNMGLGQHALTDKKQIITSLTALELISLQKAIQTRSKKSIDKFKLRQNMLIGSKVTLRNKALYNFIENFTNNVLPTLDSFSDLTSKSLKHFSNFQKNVKVINKKPYTFSYYSTTPLFYKSSLKIKSHSLSFGIDDYFSFQTIPYDKFGSISKNFGFNVNIKLNFFKSKKSNHLQYPFYVLSAFQIPVGISSKNL